MEFDKVIAARHSVRSFTPEGVDRSLVDEILRMAATAPSSKNTRSTSFLVVDDREVLGRIAQMRTSGSAFVSGAPCAIVVLGDTSKTDLWKENASISSTFIQLAATSLGLGSCWVHVCDRPRDKKDPSAGSAEDYLCSLLGISQPLRPLCVIALGYEA